MIRRSSKWWQTTNELVRQTYRSEQQDQTVALSHTLSTAVRQPLRGTLYSVPERSVHTHVKIWITHAPITFAPTYTVACLPTADCATQKPGNLTRLSLTWAMRPIVKIYTMLVHGTYFGLGSAVSPPVKGRGLRLLFFRIQSTSLTCTSHPM